MLVLLLQFIIIFLLHVTEKVGGGEGAIIYFLAAYLEQTHHITGRTITNTRLCSTDIISQLPDTPGCSSRGSEKYFRNQKIFTPEKFRFVKSSSCSIHPQLSVLCSLSFLVSSAGSKYEAILFCHISMIVNELYSMFFI